MHLGTAKIEPRGDGGHRGVGDMPVCRLHAMQDRQQRTFDAVAGIQSGVQPLGRIGGGGGRFHGGLGRRVATACLTR
jgi:hypothetical protein